MDSEKLVEESTETVCLEWRKLKVFGERTKALLSQLTEGKSPEALLRLYIV